MYWPKGQWAYRPKVVMGLKAHVGQYLLALRILNHT